MDEIGVSISSAEEIQNPSGQEFVPVSDGTGIPKKIRTGNFGKPTEYNLSAGGTKYTLDTAVAAADTVIPVANKVAGIKITFVNSDTSLPETYAFQGGTFTTADNWQPELRLENFLGLDGKPEKVELAERENGKSRSIDGTIKTNSSTSLYDIGEFNAGDIIFVGIVCSVGISIVSEINNENNFIQPICVSTINGSQDRSKNYLSIFCTRKIKLEVCSYNSLSYYGSFVKVIRNSSIKNVDARSKIFTPPSGGYNRSLYESAGAVFNETSGFYELNGLKDITEAEMETIYNETNNMFSFSWKTGQFATTSFRTNLINNDNSLIHFNKWTMNNVFKVCKKLEVLNWLDAEPNNILKTTSLAYAFYACSKLKEISKIIDISEVTGVGTTAFYQCYELEKIRLKSLKTSIGFNDSPLLSIESILYMIQNSAATSPVTITLHADAYARANEDLEIQAALQEKTNVSLASA